MEVSNLVGVLYLLVSKIGTFDCTGLLPEPIPESVDLRVSEPFRYTRLLFVRSPGNWYGPSVYIHLFRLHATNWWAAVGPVQN
jgi:hypothetical protein